MNHARFRVRCLRLLVIVRVWTAEISYKIGVKYIQKNFRIIK